MSKPKIPEWHPPYSVTSHWQMMEEARGMATANVNFASRNRRLTVKIVLTGLLLEVGVVFVVCILLDWGVLAFLAILFGLQVLYFALWVKKTIFSWVVYRIYGRKELVRAAFYFFKKNGFPEPADFEDSASGYLLSVASNSRLSVEVRLAAARELGSLQGLSTYGHPLQADRIASAMEDAILALTSGIPPKSW